MDYNLRSPCDGRLHSRLDAPRETSGCRSILASISFRPLEEKETRKFILKPTGRNRFFSKWKPPEGTPGFSMARHSLLALPRSTHIAHGQVRERIPPEATEVSETHRLFGFQGLSGCIFLRLEPQRISPGVRLLSQQFGLSPPKTIHPSVTKAIDGVKNKEVRGLLHQSPLNGFPKV